jgi:ubiquinone/menaquinone biosynthesis C-methylase UbiE
VFHENGPTFFELCRQALSGTAHGYDQLAPKFDVTPFRTPDAVIDATLVRLGKPVRAGLDLCCGTGAGLLQMRRYCMEHVVGVDFSAGMLAVARRRAAGARGSAAIELCHQDVLDLAFENAFDVATCFGAFGHIRPADEPRLVAAVHRALRAGGRFLFPTADKPPWWSPARLASHGFNAAMHVRNALWPGKFVMFYLTFTLPRAAELCAAAGFEVTVADPALEPPFRAVRIVDALKR